METELAFMRPGLGMIWTPPASVLMLGRVSLARLVGLYRPLAGRGKVLFSGATPL